ncbi:MAG TPA: NfeD family protein [Burkholderiales bacterium]|nr:NfeD family protein [Burkholderiales bacterium]
MTPELGWLLAGLALIAVELMSGTFYLLILGIAALIGAGVAYAGGGFWLQATVVAIAAVGGSVAVRRRRGTAGARDKTRPMDVGQEVTFESWVGEAQKLARVRYRGTLWDAEVDGREPVSPGAVLYIHDLEGSRLKVSRRRPS